MERIAFAVYAACVDFMLHAARLTGTTYRDANAFLFFVLWPAVTLALIAIVAWQAWRLRRCVTRPAPRTPCRRGAGARRASGPCTRRG